MRQNPLTRAESKDDNQVFTHFCDSSNNKIIEIQHENGKLKHMWIHLQDSDKKIKNKTLVFSIDSAFTRLNVYLLFEKHFIRNGKKVIEEYTNDELIAYFEEEKTKQFKTTIGYNKDGKMFHKEVYEYNEQGKALSFEETVTSIDGDDYYHKEEYEIE